MCVKNYISRIKVIDRSAIYNICDKVMYQVLGLNPGGTKCLTISKSNARIRKRAFCMQRCNDIHLFDELAGLGTNTLTIRSHLVRCKTPKLYFSSSLSYLWYIFFLLLGSKKEYFQLRTSFCSKFPRLSTRFNPILISNEKKPPFPWWKLITQDYRSTQEIYIIGTI